MPTFLGIVEMGLLVIPTNCQFILLHEFVENHVIGIDYLQGLSIDSIALNFEWPNL